MKSSLHFGIDQAASTDMAATAVNAGDSRISAIWFDIDRSTARTVFLRDSLSGRTHAVTALELLQLLPHGRAQPT